MKRTMRAAVIATTLAAPAATALGPQTSGPPVGLDRARAHIHFITLQHVPDLRFYARKDLTGEPDIRVNERGAYVDGKLVCAWPGGKFDPSAQNENLILGYSRAPDGSWTYKPCPPGFPVISTWGDEGLGGETLFIEVSSPAGPNIEVRFGEQTLYLDLNSLPGGPDEWARLPNSVFLKGPPASIFGLGNKPFVGWEWEVSEVEAERIKAAAAAEFRREPVFARFLQDVQACLDSARAPGCLVPFVQDPIYNVIFEDYGYHMPASQYVQVLWRQPADAHVNWKVLRNCFHSDDLDPGGTEARLTGEDGWTCELKLTGAGWKLADFFPGD